MVEEDKRNKRPANWEARKRKIEWEVADEEARKVLQLSVISVVYTNWNYNNYSKLNSMVRTMRE